MRRPGIRVGSPDMSRARRISSDLRHVATLAGTTAAVVEGAAIAADKARSVTEHLGVDHQDVPTEVASGRCRKKKLLVVLLIAAVAAVGFTVWKKRAARHDEERSADATGDDRFPGSMP